MLDPFMQINITKIFLILIVLNQTSSVIAEDIKDETIYGVWKPINYEFGGKDHPIEEALMVITSDYLIATAVYDLDGYRQSDANANHGPYKFIEPGKIVMDQKM